MALALGALIGLEREYATYKHRGHSIAGIRTFPLIALFGALCAYLGQTISPDSSGRNSSHRSVNYCRLLSPLATFPFCWGSYF